MQIGIDFLSISPDIISKGNDIAAKLTFESKNKSDTPVVSFTLSLLGTELPLFFIDQNNKKVKTLDFEQTITNRWKKYVIPLTLCLDKKPKRSEAVLLKLVGKTADGGTQQELSQIICK